MDKSESSGKDSGSVLDLEDEVQVGKREWRHTRTRPISSPDSELDGDWIFPGSAPRYSFGRGRNGKYLLSVIAKESGLRRLASSTSSSCSPALTQVDPQTILDDMLKMASFHDVGTSGFDCLMALAAIYGIESSGSRSSALAGETALSSYGLPSCSLTILEDFSLPSVSHAFFSLISIDVDPRLTYFNDVDILVAFLKFLRLIKASMPLGSASPTTSLSTGSPYFSLCFSISILILKTTHA
ncbi:hypothetical protein BDZ89DRAFT_1137724 [Hymenopellis radicata]|nr:hypothetical protein BDZ89DRAFT_1137724 [Hymenopellis radicata]